MHLNFSEAASIYLAASCPSPEHVIVIPEIKTFTNRPL